MGLVDNGLVRNVPIVNSLEMSPFRVDVIGTPIRSLGNGVRIFREVGANEIMLSDPIIRPRLLRLRFAPSSPHS
jgi:hypothetical protein